MRNPRLGLAARGLACAVAGSCSESTGPAARAEGLRALDSLAFTRDWVPGSLDRRGVLMTGTETLWLTPYRGWLFAALGVWHLDASRGPNPGGKVLVKKGAGEAWQVDGDFGNRILRVTALASLALRADRVGRALPFAETLLVASVSGVQYPASSERTWTWERTPTASRPWPR